MITSRQSAPTAARLPYVRLPLALARQSLYHPHILGIYAFVGRLWRLDAAPVPLSADDLHAYDPALAYSTARRALAWLVAAGWLVAHKRRGHKTRYTPAWGSVRGAVVPWDASAPLLGRPGHVRAVMLDTRVFDVCMGRLVACGGQHPASITRYLSGPALALADVGCYVQIQSGLGGTPSAALVRCGLVREGAAVALPSDDQTLLARLSQQPLFDAAAPVVLPAGLRRAGLDATPHATPTGSPLFFVEPDMAHNLTHNLAHSSAEHDASFMASERGKTAVHNADETITWNSRNRGDCITPQGGASSLPQDRVSHTAASQDEHSSHHQTVMQDERYMLLRGAGLAHGSAYYYVNKKDIDLAVMQQATAAARQAGKGPGYIAFMLREYCTTGALPRVGGVVADAPVDWAAERQKHAVQGDAVAVLADPAPVAAALPPDHSDVAVLADPAPVAAALPLFVPVALVLARLLVGKTVTVQRALRAATLTVRDDVLTVQARADDYAALLTERAMLLADCRHLGVNRVVITR